MKLMNPIPENYMGGSFWESCDTQESEKARKAEMTGYSTKKILLESMQNFNAQIAAFCQQLLSNKS